VEQTQDFQVAELRKLIAAHGLTHVWIEGLTPEDMDAYREMRPHLSLENEPLVKSKKRGAPATKRGKFADEIVPLAVCDRRP
jgi:hypothetical protein